MRDYKDKRWISKREKILRRDEYQCRECKRYGKARAASHVHHIAPVEWCRVNDTTMLLKSINLISLCRECHNQMHDRDNNELTSKGIDLLKRILGRDFYNERYNPPHLKP